jgi:hypothetical protein
MVKIMNLTATLTPVSDYPSVHNEFWGFVPFAKYQLILKTTPDDDYRITFCLAAH